MEFLLGLYETWHFFMILFEHLCRLSVCVPRGCHDCIEPRLLLVAIKAQNIRPPVETAAGECKCYRHTELLCVIRAIVWFRWWQLRYSCIVDSNCKVWSGLLCFEFWRSAVPLVQSIRGQYNHITYLSQPVSEKSYTNSSLILTAEELSNVLDWRIRRRRYTNDDDVVVVFTLMKWPWLEVVLNALLST